MLSVKLVSYFDPLGGPHEPIVGCQIESDDNCFLEDTVQ